MQEMITGRRWKCVSSIATTEAPGRKSKIPLCSSREPAGCYHVWAAQIIWAVRGSPKIQESSEIESNCAGQPEKKNRLQQGGMYIFWSTHLQPGQK